jgi:hypothetical protein
MRDRTRTPYLLALDCVQGSPSTANESLAGQDLVGEAQGYPQEVEEEQEYQEYRLRVGCGRVQAVRRVLSVPWSVEHAFGAVDSHPRP